MDWITDTGMRNLVLGFLWLETSWEFYLSYRQYKKTSSVVAVPSELKEIMKPDTFEKARQYNLARLRFGFIKSLYEITTSTIMIAFGLLAVIWDFGESINPYNDEVSTSCIWMFLLSSISTVLDLPFSIYNTFVLEESFGFNKQTVKFFILDKLKFFILIQAISVVFASVVIVIIKSGGDYFFVWLWVAVSCIALILMTIYPAVIAPLFDKYTPLPEGELRTQIENLASQLKFPLTQLYVVEGSKRSSHSNAYFYGMFKSKRIVLFDTLLAKEDGSGCQNDEILAVLSHELGHWHHNHVIYNLVITEFNLFFLFHAFSFLFNFPPIYTCLGFYNSKPVLVGLYVVLQYVMMPYNTLLSFFLTYMSRKFEFQADGFAAKLGNAEPLSRSLLQLHKDNLGFPIYDYLYSAWHHSHPPLLERLDALKKSQ